MSPFSFPTNLFSDMMQEFSIERNGEVIETAKGFFCGHNYPNTIQFKENLNIRNGDWIIDTKIRSALSCYRCTTKEDEWCNHLLNGEI